MDELWGGSGPPGPPPYLRHCLAHLPQKTTFNRRLHQLLSLFTLDLNSVQTPLQQLNLHLSDLIIDNALALRARSRITHPEGGLPTRKTHS
jgi:hypothetical protein